MAEYKTKILPISESSLTEAASLISRGELVAFPTETVYGLGALATDDEAIKKVYAVKGRPSDNPLIVHVHKDYDISSLVDLGRDYTAKLREAFLPGPLTIVYKSLGRVSPLVSCGLNTLAIRVPQSAAAQEFLKFVNLPIAAPSANISKHVSPVEAMHVYNDFNGKIPLVLDGGKSVGGIESTVLDATGEYPIILRKGLVTAEDVARVCGKCLYADENTVGKTKSPGMKYRHYCPATQTALFERNDVSGALELYESCKASGKNPVFLADGEMAKLLLGKAVLNLGNTGEEMAANLYDLLRQGERFDLIIGFKLNVNSELMMSVNNRYSKAFYKENG